MVKKQYGALEPILLTLKIPELLCKKGVEVASKGKGVLLIKTLWINQLAYGKPVFLTHVTHRVHFTTYVWM